MVVHSLAGARSGRRLLARPPGLGLLDLGLDSGGLGRGGAGLLLAGGLSGAFLLVETKLREEIVAEHVTHEIGDRLAGCMRGPGLGLFGLFAVLSHVCRVRDTDLCVGRSRIGSVGVNSNLVVGIAEVIRTLDFELVGTQGPNQVRKAEGDDAEAVLVEYTAGTHKFSSAENEDGESIVHGSLNQLVFSVKERVDTV